MSNIKAQLVAIEAFVENFRLDGERGNFSLVWIGKPNTFTIMIGGVNKHGEPEDAVGSGPTMLDALKAVKVSMESAGWSQT